MCRSPFHVKIQQPICVFFQVPSSFLSVTRLFMLLAQSLFLTQPLARCDFTSYSTQGSAQSLGVWERLCSSHPPVDFGSSSDCGTTAAADPLPTAPSANLVPMEKNLGGRTQTSVIEVDIWTQSLKYFGFLGISSGKKQFTVKAKYFFLPRKHQACFNPSTIFLWTESKNLRKYSETQSFHIPF